MTIDEREEELNKQYSEGLITYSDFALAWIQAQEDEETYPNKEATK